MFISHLYISISLCRNVILIHKYTQNCVQERRGIGWQADHLCYVYWNLHVVFRAVVKDQCVRPVVLKVSERYTKGGEKSGGGDSAFSKS